MKERNILQRSFRKTFLKSRDRKTEQGFTVVEFLIVLLGGALLVAAGGKMASMIFGTTKLAATQQALSTFRTNIQYAYTDVRSYASISNDELIKAIAVPPTMLTADKTAIVDAWNGDVTVGSADEGRSFTIELTLIPQDECVKLGAFQSATWVTITVNGTEIVRGSIVTTEQCTSETENTIVYKSH